MALEQRAVVQAEEPEEQALAALAASDDAQGRAGRVDAQAQAEPDQREQRPAETPDRGGDLFEQHGAPC